MSNLSLTPAEQYYACPHCFLKLTEDVENEESVTEESTHSPPVHPSLEKVLDAISAQPQKEKETKEDTAAKTEEAEGEGLSGCSYNFGYLANRPRDSPIPQECLTCQRIVDCMLRLGAARKDESE